LTDVASVEAGIRDPGVDTSLRRPKLTLTERLQTERECKHRIPHPLHASAYRKQLAARFVAWNEFTEPAQDVYRYGLIESELGA
jgi:hypothetical protein